MSNNEGKGDYVEVFVDILLKMIKESILETINISLLSESITFL